MEKRPQLSVIIVNYNTGSLLERCLSSLFGNTSGLAVEVFVVDNASSDDSLKGVSRFHDRLKLISNQENLGFARGCNMGFRQSCGDYVLFLNPDTEIKAEALTKMVSFIEANKEASFLVPKIYLPNGEFQESSIGPFPTLFHVILFRSSLATLFPSLKRFLFRRYLKPEGTFEVDWATGACLLCRRELLEKLKGFDEDFFMYYEDVELCYRARKMGAKVYFYHGAEIIHHQGSSCQERQMMDPIFHQSLYCLFKKSRGLPYALASMATVVLIAALKLVFFSPISMLVPKSEKIERAMKIYLFDIKWHLNLKNLRCVIRC